ncbi:MAG: hypothetical protein NZM43_12785 [Saprospiraceae bacterium]|nr:hypothetical protein [Saprospiraceae bacterium]MDW8485189.1 hypothetical protein [Saprospiraceae bacterium]
MQHRRNPVKSNRCVLKAEIYLSPFQRAWKAACTNVRSAAPQKRPAQYAPKRRYRAAAHAHAPNLPTWRRLPARGLYSHRDAFLQTASIGSSLDLLVSEYCACIEKHVRQLRADQTAFNAELSINNRR